MKVLGDLCRHIVMIASILASLVIIALIVFGLLVENGILKTEKVLACWVIEDRSTLFIAMFVFVFVTVRIFCFELIKPNDSDHQGSR